MISQGASTITSETKAPAKAPTTEVVPTGNTQLVERSPLPVAAEYGHEFRVSDLIQSPDAWAEYPQVDFPAVVDRDWIICDVMFFESLQYDNGEWCILLLQDTATQEYLTTAAGGAVLNRKLHELQRYEFKNGRIGAFPLVGRFLLKDSKVRGHQPYQDLV